MYGDQATKLILESKRAQSLDKIPLYQHDQVRSIVREIRDLQREADVLAENNLSQLDDSAIPYASDKVKQCQLFVTHLCMRRDKRCLLAYQRQRANQIDGLVWSNVEVDRESMENLSQHEQEYLSRYNELVSEFKGAMSEVDLGGSLEPPSDVFIDVRVLKDAGEIQTEYGVFNLTKDSQFFVRQADVERLIQQGYLMRL
ncbi:DEKNAAC104397 [Brettanomyces naardenensis]|uniref:DNA replication complex GINS protein PSF1 n=1 Tax=Brettanomyces naardenensis TaxID=13370 RepID=A0A448YQX2_BRENA|nr:DEKNAAC104397 [Brettanomyces naardenensis]